MSDDREIERRNPQMLGRRSNDHADGQVKWLDQYFRGVIKDEIGEFKIDLVKSMNSMMERALGGDIPKRVAKLERTMETRQLRTIAASVAVVFSILGFCRMVGWL